MTRLLNWSRRKWRFLSGVIKKILFGTTPVVPGLIVMGAQKGGTTSLYKYLSLHPQVMAPDVKEVNYFCALGAGPVKALDYQKSFPFCYGSGSDYISLDVSPAYMLDAEDVAPLLLSYNPNIKIIASLREPVSRAISAWFMYKKLYSHNPNWFTELGWVKNRTNQSVRIKQRVSVFGQSFTDDMQEEIDALSEGCRIDMPIVEYGLYETQLRPFYQKFVSTNILILDSNDLDTDTQNTLNRICDFVGLQSYDWAPSKLSRHFQGDNKQPITASESEGLARYYTLHNKELESLVGTKFEWLAK